MIYIYIQTCGGGPVGHLFLPISAVLAAAPVPEKRRESYGSTLDNRENSQAPKRQRIINEVITLGAEVASR